MFCGLLIHRSFSRLIRKFYKLLVPYIFTDGSLCLVELLSFLSPLVLEVLLVSICIYVKSVLPQCLIVAGR